MNQYRQQKIQIALLVLSLVTVVLLRSVLYTVSEREMVVVLEFGEPVEERMQPGLYFKVPFIQEVRRLPKTFQYWQTREPLVDLLTKDGEKIEVVAWAVWRITDPETFVRVLRTVENAVSSQIKVKVRSAIRKVIADNTLTQLVRNSDRELTYTFQSVLPSIDAAGDDAALDGQQPPEPDKRKADGKQPVGRREEILALVKQRVQESLMKDADGNVTDRGIELVDVGISNISFVPTVREAAFEKQKAFMESIASRHLNLGEQRKQEILNQTHREVETILGEGQKESSITRGEVDAEIIAEYAKAITKTGDFYNFIRTLEVYQNSLKGNTQLILTTDSELFRLLKGVTPAKAVGSGNKAVTTP